MPINDKGEFIRGSRPQRRPRLKQHTGFSWQRLRLWHQRLGQVIQAIGALLLLLALVGAISGVVWLWFTHRALCQLLLVMIFWLIVTD